MSAIENIQRQFWRYPGPLSKAGAQVTYTDLMAAFAEAWELGKRTEAQMWAETADLSTPDEDREQGRNPFKENP